ncbi:amidohydrolase family protein [Planctomicrobium sp. SH668]|uniref:amidohydrolase family protein n=1 Tax=Planctomicrobium sp. SH668 TaxID=3448126 RepID=UPI003F5B7385
MSPISRRRFLQASASLSTASLIPYSIGFAATTPESDSRQEDEMSGCPVSGIIDTHTHFFDPTRPEGVPFPHPNDKILYHRTIPEDFIKITQPYGVTGTVVVEASPWIEDNQWLLDLAEENPVILGIVGSLDPTHEDFLKHVARFQKNRYFKGIRFHFPEDSVKNYPMLIENVREYAATGLLVEFNGGVSRFANILELKEIVPELKVVIDHLPINQNESGDHLRAEAQLKVLAEYSNVFGKVSFVLQKRQADDEIRLADHIERLDFVFETFGRKRVMYGSNWPVSNVFVTYGAVINTIKQYLSMRPAEESELFFSGNAQQIYGLLPRN